MNKNDGKNFSFQTSKRTTKTREELAETLQQIKVQESHRYLYQLRKQVARLKSQQPQWPHRILCSSESLQMVLDGLGRADGSKCPCTNPACTYVMDVKNHLNPLFDKETGKVLLRLLDCEVMECEQLDGDCIQIVPEFVPLDERFWLQCEASIKAAEAQQTPITEHSYPYSPEEK